MKKLLLLITALFILASVEGQILRYSNYTAPTPPEEGYTTQYDAILTAMTNDPTGDTLTWQDDLIYSLDSAGYWDRIKLLYMPIGASSLADSYINWADPGTYDLTDPGSTNPGLNRVEGWNASGDYLSTGWNPYTDSTLIGKNDLTLAAWCLDHSTSRQAVMGVEPEEAVTRMHILPNYNNYPRIAINELTETMTISDIATRIGFVMGSRTTSTGLIIYKNGSSMSTYETASVSLPNGTLFLLARNYMGSPLWNYTGIVSIILVMDGVSSTEAANIYAIFNRYMTRIGEGI